MLLAKIWQGTSITSLKLHRNLVKTSNNLTKNSWKDQNCFWNICPRALSTLPTNDKLLFKQDPNVEGRLQKFTSAFQTPKFPIKSDQQDRRAECPHSPVLTKKEGIQQLEKLFSQGRINPPSVPSVVGLKEPQYSKQSTATEICDLAENCATAIWETRKLLPCRPPILSSKYGDPRAGEVRAEELDATREKIRSLILSFQEANKNYTDSEILKLEEPRFEQAVDIIIKNKLGNSGEYTLVAAWLLRKKYPNMKIDIIQAAPQQLRFNPYFDVGASLEPSGFFHEFVIIGESLPPKKADGSYPDFKEWGDSIFVVDAFLDVACLPRNYKRVWQETINEWHKNGVCMGRKPADNWGNVLDGEKSSMLSIYGFRRNSPPNLSIRILNKFDAISSSIRNVLKVSPLWLTK